MDLKTFVASLPVEEREQFAKDCETTIGHLRNVMYGLKSCATDLAVRIEMRSGGKVTRPELRPDWRNHWPELAAAEPTKAAA